VLEQHRLALHHGQGGLGTDVTEAQDGGAVRHDRDGARHPGVVVDQVGVLRDGRADARDTGGVGQRQVVAGLERDGQPHLDLAPAVQGEGGICIPVRAGRHHGQVLQEGGHSVLLMAPERPGRGT
jgi:hypothetical protein